MKIPVVIFFFFLVMCHAIAQDNFGIAGSSRAPANTVLVNPSTIVDSRAFLDFNLIGFGAFARNNFVHIPGNEFSISGISSIEEPSYARDHAPYSVYGDVVIHGPSATFTIRQHAFGIHSSVRVVADGRGIPKTLGYYMTEGFQYREQMGVTHTVRDLRANALSWMEVGGTYGTIIGRSGNQLTLGGLTVKKLFGIAGAGIRLDEWKYMITDSSSMETFTLRGEYGFNEPAFNSGSGWSCDLGITVKKLNRSAEGYSPHSPCTNGDYKYRYGVSLVDIGAIKFEGTVYRNVFNETEQSQWDDFSNTNANDTQQLDSLVNAGFSLSQENSDLQKFSMKLPTGISAQMDYNLGYNFYFYGAMMIGIPWKNSMGVQRASFLGIAPRYELKRIEVSLPLTLYEFRYPQFGFMIRLNSIIIGSDNIGPLLFNQDVYGADIYFNLKYTIFRHWNCKKEKEKSKSKLAKGGRWVPCPSW